MSLQKLVIAEQDQVILKVPVSHGIDVTLIPGPSPASRPWLRPMSVLPHLSM